MNNANITLFDGTSDEITIDGASRELISVPAYRLAELINDARPTERWNTDSIVLHYTRLVYDSIPEDERKARHVKMSHCRDAVVARLEGGLTMSRDSDFEKLRHAAVEAAEHEFTAQQEIKRQTSERRRRERKLERDIEKRKKLYEDYGMRVPSRNNIIAELGRPFKPSKRAERKRAIEDVKRSFGRKDG